MPPPLSGLHHVSALAGPPQPNADFYVGVLGLRLVKRTVNFDDPGTYHLYYGDETGSPGSLLTFFPWPEALPGRAGEGTIRATALAVPAGSLDEWMGRFADLALDFEAPEERFGEGVVRFRDPDGLVLEFTEAGEGGAAPVLLGLRGATLALADPASTASFLAGMLGLEAVGEEGGRLRFQTPGGEAVVDLVRDTSLPRPGRGTVHHIAFRVPDGEALRAWQRHLLEAGLGPTDVRDRRYFESVYVREPGGVLLELATDGPGFLIDEPEAELGASLRLPPWLEPRREQIERRLLPLRLPSPQKTSPS